MREGGETRRCGLGTRRDEHLIETVVLAALGLRAELSDRLARAVRDGLDPEVIREALVMVLPYAGFPRALSALAVLADVAGEASPPERSPTDAVALRTRGEERFRAIYGEAADSILSRIRSTHPELPEWLLTDAYGRVLAREGLDLVDREVLGVAMLAAFDQPDQLQGHVRGGLRNGADPARLRAAVEIAAGHVEPEVGRRARERLERELG